MSGNKYHVSKVRANNITYDSKAECDRHWMLIQKEKNLEILALHYHQIRFTLGISDKNRAISYTPDFTYIEDGELVAEEVKGFRVRDWPVRAALFKEQFPEWRLYVRSA